MEVAVAVVSWNTRELLRDCLESLAADAGAGRAGVWVIDNASTDGSAEMVAAEFPWVELIAERRNLGFGAGVNRIAAVVARHPSRPTWLAPANADIRLAPDALGRLLDAGRADPAAGILAPRLRGPDGRFQHSVHPFPGPGVGLAVDLGLARLAPSLGERLTLDGRWDAGRSRRVDWAHGAFLLVRLDAFAAVGGFDPGQFLYAEDLDIAWRLTTAGWPTRYVPDAVVEHVESAAIDQLYGASRDLRAERAAAVWLRRSRGTAVWATSTGLALGGAFVRTVASLPDALSGDPDRRELAWRARRALVRRLRSLRQAPPSH